MRLDVELTLDESVLLLVLLTHGVEHILENKPEKADETILLLQKLTKLP